MTLAALGLALVAASGAVHGTLASFNGETRNGGNTFALTSLYAPGSLTATPSGLGVDVEWTAGQNGNSYELLSAPAPNPLVNDCTGVTFTPLATQAATTYRHGLAVPPGLWRCYTVRTKYQSWTSVENNPVAGARLGFVASIVSFTNTGNARIDAGDELTITFNQPVATATGPGAGNTICWQANRIVLGSTTQTGNCAANDTSPRLGFLTGGTIQELPLGGDLGLEQRQPGPDDHGGVAARRQRQLRSERRLDVHAHAQRRVPAERDRWPPRLRLEYRREQLPATGEWALANAPWTRGDGARP